MHKRKSSVHYGSNIYPDEVSCSSPDLEIEREERLSKIFSLHVKGLSQSDIASKLCVNQSTISRDLDLLRKMAKKKVQQYLNEDIPFEYLRILKGSDELIKTTWHMIEAEQDSSREKYHLLNLLDSLYTKRLQLIIGGKPGDGGPLNLRSCLSDLRVDDLYPRL